MTLVPSRSLLEDAVLHERAVPSFNVITLEHVEAIVAGAERTGSGVLLQLSENAIKYHGGRAEPLLAASRELADAASVPIGIHLDHIQDRKLAERLIALAPRFGIGSLMFDAANLDYAANVAATTEVTEAGHAAGLWIEAELGEIGGKDGAHAPGVRTDPTEAADFVAATGVDGLAVAVGSSHAMTERAASLDLTLIAELAARLPVPLVLHGSSGVPDETIALAVAAGIRKVNIGTVLNVVWTGSIRATLADNSSLVDPRRYFRGARDEMTTTVAALCAVVSPSPSL